ncbi:MAG: hypothetical protein ABIE74_02020 [Pseudomonadota bacterium]
MKWLKKYYIGAIFIIIIVLINVLFLKGNVQNSDIVKKTTVTAQKITENKPAKNAEVEEVEVKDETEAIKPPRHYSLFKSKAIDFRNRQNFNIIDPDEILSLSDLSVKSIDHNPIEEIEKNEMTIEIEIQQ